MKIIKGDLVLEKDTVFEESIKVVGNIKGKDGERFNLRVVGNIDAENIDAGNIYAWNIDARNIGARDINARNINAWDIDAWNTNAWDIDARDIDARNINAWDIDAGDIDAGNIICVSRKKKSKKAKTMAYSIVLDRFNCEKKEVMPE